MQVGNQVLKVPTFWPWQLISYGFLHGSLTHIFFNMFALYLFGLPLEAGWGRSRFALYYLVCLVGAGLVQLVVASTSAEIYPTVGASGAVFGLLLAYGLRFPNNVIVLLIPPIPIKAKYFVILYGAAELLFGVTGMMPGVAHFAHLGGMLFGLVLLWKWGWRPGR
jgi:membrane associated rhomboid family serine protease